MPRRTLVVERAQVCIFVPMLLLLACATTRAAFVERAPCPPSPNCVSSVAADEVHAIAPFPARPDAIPRIAAVIRAQPRTEVVDERDGYLRATFTSRLMRYVDDVEFWVDGDVLHVRSASRVGVGDMGVNRARVETLRAAYTEE